MQPLFKCFQEPCRIVCEKWGACIRRCLGGHRLLHHADLQTGTTVGLEEAIHWQAKNIEERVTAKRRWRQRSEGSSVAETLTNVPHRWLGEASVLYLYLLITCCAWLHTFSSLPVPTLLKRWICLTWNNTSPFFTPSNLCQQHSTMGPLFMDWHFKAWKQEMKWEEKRMENCLSCPSPSLYIAYLSLIIGPFNVPGECR